MWYEPLIIIAILVHVNSVIYSVYLHRGKAHNYYTFHPVLEHTFRFLLWFTRSQCWPGFIQNYSANHRKHHVYVDVEGDPHSPHIWSFLELSSDLWGPKKGRPHYISYEEQQKWAGDLSNEKYSWLDKNVYQRYPRLGILMLWTVLTLCYGWIGFLSGWVCYVVPKYIGIFVGSYGIHKFGVKYHHNSKKAGQSTIVGPWGLWWGGEELHENHHMDPTNPNWAKRWYEVDIGYWYSKLFEKLGLLTFTKDSGK